MAAPGAGAAALLALLLAVVGCDLVGSADRPPGAYPIVVSAIGLEDEADPYAHLYAVSLDGEAVRLAGGAFGDRYPAFSPDGARLAFVSGRAGVTAEANGVYVADAQGRGAAPLTRVGGEGPLADAPVHAWETPSWHPTSGEVAFSSYAGCGATDDILIAAVGAPARCLVTGAHDEYFPAWSPDGRALAFSSDRADPASRGAAELYRLDVETGDVRPLTALGVRAVLPRWSPDGSELAFYVRGPRGAPVAEEGLWILDLATGASRRLDVPLPAGEVAAGTVRWLPGGDQLLVVAIGDAPPHLRTLYRYDRAAGRVAKLLSAPEFAGVDWNPVVPAP